MQSIEELNKTVGRIQIVTILVKIIHNYVVWK